MSHRGAAIAGLLFALAWAGLLIYGTYVVGERPEGTAAADWFTEQKTPLAILVVGGLVALLLFLWFLMGLGGTLQRMDEGGSAALAFAAGSVAVPVLLLQLAATALPLVADKAAASYDTLVALSATLATTLAGVAALPLAVFVGAASISAIKHEGIEPWVGWLGILVAAALLTTLLFPFGFAWLGIVALVAAFAFPAWVLLAALGVASKSS